MTKRAAWHSVNSLSRNIIYALAEDKSGRLLIGSASGFYVGPKPGRGVSDADQSFARIGSASGAVDAPGSVRAIAQFQGGIYIASFGRGVERIDEGRGKRVWPSGGAESPEVLSLFPDGDRRLLIGTTNGVVVFDGQSTKPEPAFEIFKDTVVRSVDRAGDGSIWFATGRGVFLCAANGNCIGVAPGFDARSIVANHDANAREAWCATKSGWRVNKDPV